MVIAWSAGSLVGLRRAVAGPAPRSLLRPRPARGGRRRARAGAAGRRSREREGRLAGSPSLGGPQWSHASRSPTSLACSSGTRRAPPSPWTSTPPAGAGRVDLGTVVRHEIGHALGLPHGTGLMAPTLSPGESSGVGAEYAEPAPETPTAPAPTRRPADRSDPTSRTRAAAPPRTLRPPGRPLPRPVTRRRARPPRPRQHPRGPLVGPGGRQPGHRTQRIAGRPRHNRRGDDGQRHAELVGVGAPAASPLRSPPSPRPQRRHHPGPRAPTSSRSSSTAAATT